MIGIKRMKTDLIGQAVLIAGVLAAALSGLPQGPWLTLLALLGLWQIVSALHLAVFFEYQQRYPFLWALILSALAMMPGLWLLGLWALAPFCLALAAYFGATLRDTLSLLQRPRSFWDL